MNDSTPTFLVSSSPHDHSGASIRRIMLDVVIALLPACAAALWLFRVQAALLLLVCIGACLSTEILCRLLMRRKQTISDGSALVTGILLALNLPPDLPLWQAALGSAVAIALGKQIFGGLGKNPFNPALVGRAFLLISFTAGMTTWSASSWHHSGAPKPHHIAQEVDASGAPVTSATRILRFSDATTTATPLGASKAYFKAARASKSQPHKPFAYNNALRLRFFLGDSNGCIGETSALALLLGAVYLLLRRVITWHVPVACLGTVFLYAAIAHAISPAYTLPAEFHLLSGGLLLGTFFMATDMATTPITRSGLLLFGIGCGLLTMIIRTVPTGAYPEGMSFAILIMNATTPLINRATRPKPYGTRKA